MRNDRPRRTFGPRPVIRSHGPSDLIFNRTDIIVMRTKAGALILDHVPSIERPFSPTGWTFRSSRRSVTKSMKCLIKKQGPVSSF
jgi:hypothetical protein